MASSESVNFIGVTQAFNDSVEIFGVWIGETFVWPDPWSDIWDDGANNYWMDEWRDMWSTIPIDPPLEVAHGNE